MAKIYLARHGETTWNVAGRYQGRLESPLSDRGREQAAALAAAFTSKRNESDSVPTRIISSPLARCRDTIAPLAALLELPVEIDERLVEIGHGSWEGLLRDEIINRDGERYKKWREEPADVFFPGGESLQNVADRWNDFANDLRQVSESVMVLSHDAVVRVALLGFLGRPLNDLWKMHVENAAFAVIEHENGELILREESRVTHLETLRASIAGQAL